MNIKKDEITWWQTAVINRRAWTWENQHQHQQLSTWWQNAVLYQINPWSFLDTNGDGKGDLDGILTKLDYVVGLGVEAIWLSPIFESPMDDLGYDITNMCEIDPMFGTLADFDRLVAAAQARGLKVVIDQVWNHTSAQHPWFVESRKSRTNPKADWYIWADAKPDGSPPNNWMSSFLGDSAWKWVPEREQYYFYNFLESQPDLNWNNPDVVDAILERAKFWLNRGVDGFRLDAVNYFIHDEQLRDNPQRPEDASLPDGVPPDNPLNEQMLKYSFCRPENLDALKPIRELVDQYPGVVTIGEVTLCEDSVALAGEYVAGTDRLHMAYHSGLLSKEPLTSKQLQNLLKRVQKHFSEGGACWIVGNHDYGRLRSQWIGKEAEISPYPDEFYGMIAALLISLPGAFCLYQGDELGLPEARIPEDIPEEEIKDPFGKALYPDVVGRDGSRVPMPWQSNLPNAGFTSAEKAWLPIPQNHIERSVNLQDRDPGSLLNTWRRLLHWRKKQPALTAGSFSLIETEEPLLVFIREYAEQCLLCIFNLSDQYAHYELPRPDVAYGETIGLGFAVDKAGNMLKIPGYGVFFGDLTPPKAN